MLSSIDRQIKLRLDRKPSVRAEQQARQTGLSSEMGLEISPMGAVVQPKAAALVLGAIWPFSGSFLVCVSLQ